MPTFTITDAMISGSSSDPQVVALDFTDVGRDVGISTNFATEDPGDVTFVGEAGLDNIDQMTITGIGDSGASDVDILRFDLSTFADSFSIAVSLGGDRAPSSDDFFVFEDADTITDNGSGNWTVTHSSGGTSYTLNVFAGDAQVVFGMDGVVDGEDTGEVMGDGYDDATGANDGGGDIIGSGDGDDNDSIRGNDGNDTIDAGSGNDSIDGGQGDDDIQGGTGDDLIFGDNSSQSIVITGDGELYLYDAASGDSTLLQNGLQQYGDITVGEDGTIYGVIFNAGAASDAGIYSIDPATGTETLVYDLPEGSGRYAGLGTDPSGNLYLIDYDTDDITRLAPDGSGGFTDDGTALASLPANTFDVTFIDDSTAWVTTSIGVYSYDVDGSGNFSNPTDLGQIDGSSTIYGLHMGDDGRVYAFEDDGSVFSTDPTSLPPVWDEEDDIADTSIWGSAPAPNSVQTDGDDSLEGEAGDDTLVGDAGDDTLDGGDGLDSMDGGTGDDVFFVDQGDTAIGGDGDDTFNLEDLDTTGTGNAAIDIVGGEGSETGGDTLVLTSDVSQSDITFTNTDDAAGGLSGTFTMPDGTVVTFSEIENIICFTHDTLILTEQGERPVQDLCRGDRVLTRDHGIQPVRWVGKRTVPGTGRFAPVRFAPNVLQSQSELIVSPQHRVLLKGHHAELLFGESEVLAAAKHLVNGKDVVQEEQVSVTYYHIMFDEHEVIYSNGAPTESLHAGDVGLGSIAEDSREELFALFPDLRHWSGGHGPSARTSLKRFEAELISERMLA